MKQTAAELTPELVPEPLWGLSARYVLPRAAWEDRIRARVLAEAGSRCSVCGVSKARGMVCHEVWDYDDAASTATLTGFVVLCPDCNLVHHMGRASQLGLRGRALDHMAEVNGLTYDEVVDLVDRAFEEWERRSQRRWAVAVVPALRSRYPDLAAMDNTSGSPGEGRQRVRARGA